MKCKICGKSNEKSVCSDCENKKRCKVCNILKTDFYKYKNGKLYSTCIEFFNKKVKCEFCNKEFNKTYLSKHLKRCTKLLEDVYYLNNNQIDDDNENQIDDDNNQIDNNQINDDNENHNNQIDDNNNNQIDNNCNRTLIVGPSFCGKTHLLLNKLQLIRLDDNTRKIHIITRSPEQYSNTALLTFGIEIDQVKVEEDLEDKSIQDFQNCCVVFDDIMDTSQKLIDPFFTRGRHNDLDVYYLSQSYFDSPKRTIRNNSNIIILFQQTLKDVQHIYTAGFDMSYDEFKELCREAWQERYNYLLLNRLEDKNGKKYMICNESNPQYQVFSPQTDSF